jgi:NAD(P)-dependent dehydrogenase (short-subunit alcohol dehydrogenase family)
MARLEGKVAIVTGATSGIGRRTAERFVAEGALVALAGRRAELGAALAAELGSQALFVPTDVSVEADVKALVAATVERWGRVDVLFNNAGGPGQTGGIEGLEVDAFDEAFATNVRSVMLGMKHVAPIMKAQRSGSIINNASVAGSRAGFSSSVVYSATKAAVIQLTRSIAMELGEHFVRVNSISPGGIATGIFAKAINRMDADEADRMAERAAKVLAAGQPIPRAGQPDDIAGAAVFLASDDAAFVNGIDLVVDGGLIQGRLWTPQQQGVEQMRGFFDR